FGRLLQHCRGYLMHIAADRIDPHWQARVSASDLVQDVFLEVLRFFDRFQGSTEAELLAWLRAVLDFRASADWRRFTKTAKRQPEREVGAAALAGVAADVSSPSSVAVRAEQVRLVSAALARLPEHYRQIIAWRQWQRLPFAEIGRLLGKSEDAA